MLSQVVLMWSLIDWVNETIHYNPELVYPPPPPFRFTQFMRVMKDVFGAGDIVRFPLPLIQGDTNIGHWQIAHNQGISTK